MYTQADMVRALACLTMFAQKIRTCIRWKSGHIKTHKTFLGDKTQKAMKLNEHTWELISSNPVHILISFYAYFRDEAEVLVSGWGKVLGEGIGGRWLYSRPD